ncbi:type II toxin-antitoxin system RnlB family antitoxin [Endozoicomonas sp. 8E]|uniref:type II toxin-antitoxin system RnlB family antitoxin n=1 Tax=Endozoicomonas sp. 8E TaxID=3035692 RepID=UPI002938E22A|nr:type II toxin-antitoxin system RnlB family antitoxin [Endozoicomonas sp. 8E]WOG27231.1 type II toxin-antitoxin system RnlB family antitoxin [Endozoicomonas sp. 8E]
MDIITIEPFLKELSAELKSIDHCGVVVFDLLVFNGRSDDRFSTLLFNGKSFDGASFKILSDIDQNIINKLDDYFRTHPVLPKKSVLSFSLLKNFLKENLKKNSGTKFSF